MKYYSFEKYKNTKGRKASVKSKKKIFLMFFIAVIIGVFSFYVANEEFREFIDKYILIKEINENDGTTIDISGIPSSFIYAYDRYIVVLDKNNLSKYNNNGKKEFNIEVNISSPLFASNNRFLVLAEENGQKLYLILRGKYFMAERYRRANFKNKC